jgi:hypothetical protein
MIMFGPKSHRSRQEVVHTRFSVVWETTATVDLPMAFDEEDEEDESDEPSTGG